MDVPKDLNKNDKPEVAQNIQQIFKQEVGFPVNSIDDSTKEILLMPEELLDHWPSLVDEPNSPAMEGEKFNYQIQ
jgi:hypothetical protein